MQPLTDANLIFRALIILGLIIAGFFVAADQGALAFALGADKSYISHLILIVYVAACGHWLWLAQQLSGERRRCAALEGRLSESGPVVSVAGGAELSDEAEAAAGRRPNLAGEAAAQPTLGRAGFGAGEAGLVDQFAIALGKGGAHQDGAVLLTAFADELANRHALGHFISDALLKLGLLGTIIGFILMLKPLGEIDQFDPSLMQQLLTAMSGGMAVALHTTLAGLVTSTLLKLQYHVLDGSAAELATRLTVVTANVPAPK